MPVLHLTVIDFVEPFRLINGTCYQDARHKLHRAIHKPVCILILQVIAAADMIVRFVGEVWTGRILHTIRKPVPG